MHPPILLRNGRHRTSRKTWYGAASQGLPRPPFQEAEFHELQAQPAQILTCSFTHKALTKNECLEASIKMEMQDAEWWKNPPCQDWSNSLPPHLCALAAAGQDILPPPIDATFEDARLIKITGQHGIGNNPE